MSGGAAFYAYPSEPAKIGWTISAALELRKKGDQAVAIMPWPKVPNIGLRLDEKVREQITGSVCLIADITVPNFNVYYEIGFAVGRGKPIVPTLDITIEHAKKEVVQLGLFDTVGYLEYSNADELEQRLESLNDRPLLSEYAREPDYQQPLFFLDSLAKTDFRNRIVSAIKSARVFYRSYDPVETPRLSATDAIGFVTASSGIVLPLLASNIIDSERHNTRAAFLAGLAHGLNRKAILIQLNELPAPADYREFIENVRDPGAVTEIIAAFARDGLAEMQEIAPLPRKRRNEASQITRLSLGASAAENEFRHLQDYFIQTFQFRRAMDGTGKIVVGRKGSGKTAIFFQVRDKKREDRRNVIVDLKPESHQLTLLRENILQLHDIGVFDHTIAAFWQYLIHVEILLKLREQIVLAPQRARDVTRDTFKVAQEIDRLFDAVESDMSGDFTSRLSALVNSIVLEIEALQSREQRRPSVEELTNIIFQIDLRAARTLIEKSVQPRTVIVFLFDNIDKGWSARGVKPEDVRLVRLLIEALNKMQRDLRRHGIDLQFLVFLRNDIYELLIDETSDRGKEGQILIDWSDHEQLKRIILERIQYSLDLDFPSFTAAWRTFFVPTIDGVDSFEYLAKRCLMRPRFLIDLIENCISIAVNRGHDKVSADDLKAACRQHSYYLISDFGYEIRDVSSVTHDLFYAFIGIGELVTYDEVRRALGDAGISETDRDRIIELLLWYGFLGLALASNKKLFIYDVEYDFNRLKALRTGTENTLYCINPAFIDGLMH
jgi:hypothetical protein